MAIFINIEYETILAGEQNGQVTTNAMFGKVTSTAALEEHLLEKIETRQNS